jgi:hypothetical protein
VIQAPRGFLLPRFVNVGRHLMTATVAPRPHRKTFRKAEVRCGLDERKLSTGSGTRKPDL